MTAPTPHQEGPGTVESTSAEESSVQTVRQGAVWSAARSVVLRTAGQLTTIVVVRIVSPDEFGVWALAITVHSIISNLADLGVASQLIRRDMDKDALAPSASFVALTMSAVLGALMFAGSGMLASFLGAAAAAPVIRVMALSVVLMGLSAVPSSLLARDFRQNALFLASVASMIVGNSALLLLALAGAGPLAFAWSTVLGQIAAGVFMVRQIGWVWPRPNLEAVKVLLRLGAPLSVANVINFAYLNLDYAVVSRLKGATVLGIYLLAFNVSSWPYAILSSSINGVSMPAFSAATNPDHLRERVATVAQAVALVSFPAAGMLTALAGPLVATFYGDNWTATASVLPLLAPYGAVFLITLVLGNVLVATGRSGSLLVLQIVWFAALLPTMVFFVGRFGPRGAALAHLTIVLLVAAPAYTATVRRLTGVGPLTVLRAVRAPALFATCAATVAWTVGRLTDVAPVALVLGGLVGSAFYAVAAAPLLLNRFAARLPFVGRVTGWIGGLTMDVASRCRFAWLYE